MSCTVPRKPSITRRRPVLLGAADQQYMLVAAVLMGHAAAGALAWDWHRRTRTAPCIPRCAGTSSAALR
jgi:hypothetical protein